MPSLAFRSARDLARAIARRRIGCLELLDCYLERIERLNPRLNAVVVLDVERARQRARAADRAVRRGQRWGPLHGVPMTVKESYDVVGMPTTCGVPELKDNFPAANALAVERLLGAGAVVFGKTNVPIHLADWQSYNAIYGVTSNPWDTSRTPGGSSGGSAAALAAGLTALEAGSDIGASIRNPAHYCGVYGHKPTWGIVPPRGQGMPGRVAQGDISAVGPMARSAGDLALALDVMAGPDPVDGAGWRLALPAPARRDLRGHRVALVLSDPVADVDRAVQDRLQDLADFLGRRGVRVDDRARPDLDSAEVQRVYVLLLRAATSGRQTAEEFAQNAEAARRLSPDDQTYYAGMVRGSTLPHREWLALNEARHRMRLRWAQFFARFDLLLCPAASGVAFPHDHAGQRHERTIAVNGRTVPTTDQLFWAGYTGGVYLPSTVAPCGRTPEGLPVGVQIAGPQYGDRACIHFARLLEREYGGFVPPPGYE